MKSVLAALMASAFIFMGCISISKTAYIYTVTVADTIEHGTITPSKSSEVGTYERITLSIVPENGYELDVLTITSDADGKEVKVSDNEFRMPGASVTVTATFTKCAETKAKPDAVGDVVLNDGRVVAYENINNMTDKQKAKAVAVIFYVGTECSNGGETRTLGVGLHNALLASWCMSNASALDREIGAIRCKAEGTAGNYTFTGDRNGSDNLSQIVAYLKQLTNVPDDTGLSAKSSFYNDQNYPAFYFAKNYKDLKYQLPGDNTAKPFSRESIFGDGGNWRTPNLGKSYSDGWYLPTIAELFQVWKVKDKIDAVSALCNGSNFSKEAYVSSSVLDNTAGVAYLQFSSGECGATEKYKTGFAANSKNAINKWTGVRNSCFLTQAFLCA